VRQKFGDGFSTLNHKMRFMGSLLNTELFCALLLERRGLNEGISALGRETKSKSPNRQKAVFTQKKIPLGGFML